MDETLTPVLHSGDSVRLRMADTAIALLPAVAGALWFFRLRGLLILALATAGAFGTELLWSRLRRRESWKDGSAVVSGLLLGLLLPGSCPWWAALAGGAAAAAYKLLHGGLGKNLLNPAALARALLLLLPALRADPLRTASGTFFIDYRGGALGETGTLLLLAGAVYLAVRQLLAWEITLPALAASFLTALAIPGCDPAAVLAWGGTWLGAVFLASDPVTSPMGLPLRMVYGLLCGGLGVLGAYYGWGAAGLCCGILGANLLGRGGEWVLLRLGDRAAR